MKKTKQTLKPEINKQLKFRGKLVKLIMPNSCKPWMRFANFALAVFYKGKRRDKSLNYRQIYIKTEQTENLRLCVYERKNSTAKNKPLVFWIHGGGYGIGVPEVELSFYQDFLTVSDCVIISPDYTRSVQKPYPSALIDCYSALVWARALRIFSEPRTPIFFVFKKPKCSRGRPSLMRPDIINIGTAPRKRATRGRRSFPVTSLFR